VDNRELPRTLRGPGSVQRGSGFGLVAVTSCCGTQVVDVAEAVEAASLVLDDVKKERR
jgi:hypothetical protein